MKISFNVGWWVSMFNNEKEIIFTTSDDNGNEIELIFNKKDFFTKRHLKEFIENLNKLKEKSQ